MPKSYKAIKAKVELKVKRATITSLNNYLNKINVPLWGTIQGKNFIEQLILTLFKDMYAVGYNRLWEKTKLWVGIAASSLHHNIKVIRLAAAGWAESRSNWVCKPIGMLLHVGQSWQTKYGEQTSGWTPLI